MKRILLVAVLLLATALALVGCGGGGEPATTPAPSTPHVTTPSVTTPQATTPAPTTPLVTTPPVTTPAPTTPPVTTPPTTTPPTPETYTVKFFDETGRELASVVMEKGQTPLRTYTVSDTAEWDYTFRGWATSAGGSVLPSLPAVTGNASYYAVVTKVKQTYTVTFDAKGGSAVASQTVEYGAKALKPENPRLDGYKFVSWCSDAACTTPVDFDAVITQNVTYYAAWNEVVDAKALLSALLSGTDLNPFAYIPESMLPTYSANLVNASELPSSYESFTSVTALPIGFGEQWHMVLENLEQSKTFFSLLSVVETLSASSVAAFNNYFDQNPADTAEYAFTNGNYNVTIALTAEMIAYAVEYTATFPLIGEQTAQIVLAMDIDSGERYVRIQIGDANALTYTMLENSYTFAIKYAGVRRALFSVERAAHGAVVGSIYEYLTVAGVELASCAEFCITEDYVSVVGNKASGMIGFTGHIVELYDTSTGRLLGYEVQETLSSIVYNTLWLNLADVSGISSIKYLPAEGGESARAYVNGLSSVWQAKKVGGLGSKMFSRRFDIELRTQYVYSYDPTSGEYTEHQIDVPMLFVQQEYLETLTSDVRSENNITVLLNVERADLQKLISDYETLIPIFITIKDLITPDVIVAFIGEKFVFS